MKIRYRILEFAKAVDKYGSKYSIEEGVSIYEISIFGFVIYQRIKWETVADNGGLTVAFKSYREAVEAVEEMKEQQPIYHKIK